MFLALRDLRFARGRFGLMATVVALISLLVVLLSGLTAGLSNQSISAVTSLPADRLSFARPADGAAISFSTSRVTGEQARALASQPGVVEAALLGIAPARLAAGGTETSVTAFGVDPGVFLSPDGLSARSVVVSRELASTDGLSVGDEVTLGGQRFTIAGLADHASFNHTPVVWMPRAAWMKLDAAAGAQASVVALRTNGAVNAAALDGSTGTVTKTVKGSLSAVGSYTAENGSLSLMRALLLAVSALVVGAFFTVWTIQRTPDLAVLKAMGASTGYLVKDALVQAAVVLGIGGGLGTLLASGLGTLAARVVPFVVTPATTLVPLLLLLIVGMVGAAASLRRIGTVDPLTALGAAR